MRISDVARQTGLPASTIRFYESAGLVEPAARDTNGYRSYEAADVQRLSFIAGAKQLDLGMAEVRQLLAAREQSDRCEHVQREMREVVVARLVETEARIAELRRVAEDLRRTEERLSAPVAGACSDDCACAALSGAPLEIPAGATVLNVLPR